MDKLKLKSETTDGAQTNIELLAQLFPECVTECEKMLKTGGVKRAVDFDKLRQILSSDNIADDREERYQFTWPDKRNAIRLANTPTSATLRPVREESVDFDNTKNLYIEGDNLDVLKLLKTTYLHSVKMIYIDPPYNTGNDFVFKDDFTQSAEEYRAQSGQYDEQGNRLFVNTESNGRFHTDWLNMIYPRLRVARDLLADDGVIFISIDDNEVANLKKVCDEIFGEGNFVAQIIVENNPRGRQSDAFFATSHEYLICFAKNSSVAAITDAPLTELQKADYKYYDEVGQYRLLGLRQRGVASLRQDRPEMYFPIYVNPQNQSISLSKKAEWEEVHPKKSDGRDGRWMWGKKKCQDDKSLLVARLVSTRNEYDIFVKDYLNKNNSERTRKYKTVWSEKHLNNQIGTQQVKALLGGDYMSFPKSLNYIRDVVRIGTSPSSLVLDFFSGSATTAHAVMQLNAEDGGHRRYICVQLPEETGKDSEARKAGYNTICEIGKERIRRAGAKIKADSPLTTKDLDTGFRVLRIDSSNMEDVYYTPAETEQGDLFSLVNNVKADRTAEDLLFQVMLELGITLDSQIEKEEMGGKTLWSVHYKKNEEEKHLIACFDKGLTDEVVKVIAQKKPTFAVLCNNSIADDQTATNFEQIFRTYTPDTTIKIL